MNVVVPVFPASNEARTLSLKMKEMRVGVFQDVRERSSKYRFDIWDFAGQLLYYTAHQTFLSERTIYLLTMDMSQPLDKELPTEIVYKRKETGSPKTAQGATEAHFTTYNSICDLKM